VSDQARQNYGNHARYVPLFHFVLAGLLLLNLAWTIRHVIKLRSAQHWVELLVAIALLIVFWYMRRFATTVQDRVIRLVETLRYQRVLPPDLQARAGALTVEQFVALRFASDAELPALARRALDEHLEGKAIKQAVKDWRADHLRA